MKNLYVAVISTLLVCSAYGQTTSNSTANPNATASSANQGNNQAIQFNSPGAVNTTYGGDYTIRNVPSVNGPNLTSGFDTCMGSTSGSVNIAGFGIGGGKTYVDENCKRIKLSRELWNMGMKAGAIALLCKDEEVRQALIDTGYVCPNGRRKENE
jgi:hypothetical protein